jgi:SAM-dependent methyltransferase
VPERGWHTIEFPDGTVSTGAWDFRPLSPKLPWPDVSGKRCLDIGTADGFWAFELERRGAAEVVALDRPSYFQSECRARFEAAHAKLGSRVRYEEGDVHELEGEFDLAFMGYVLQVVANPVGALESVRRGCTELLVLDTVSVPLSLLPSPLARIDAAARRRRVVRLQPARAPEGVEMAGWTVEAQTGILADKTRYDWKHRVGLRGRACAILARA